MTKSWKVKWAKHVARSREKRNAYRILVVRPEGKRQLGRPKCEWEDAIKMYLRKIGCCGMVWIDLAHGREQWRVPVNTVMNLRVP
jgi:hypothetical protein